MYSASGLLAGVAWGFAVACGISIATYTSPAASAENTTIAITAPQAGTTVHNNNGVVEIAISMPSGALSADHRLRVLMDGKPYGTDQRALQFTLRGVDRGEHALQVQLLDRKDAIVASSATVTFYLWQASSQFPGRKPPPK